MVSTSVPKANCWNLNLTSFKDTSIYSFQTRGFPGKCFSHNHPGLSRPVLCVHGSGIPNQSSKGRSHTRAGKAHSKLAVGFFVCRTVESLLSERPQRFQRFRRQEVPPARFVADRITPPPFPFFTSTSTSVISAIYFLHAERER